MVNRSDIGKALGAALFVVFYSIVIGPRTALFGTRADMGLILTVWAALSYGPDIGILVGFVSGLMMGMLNPSELGWSALLLSFVGYGAGSLRSKLVVGPLPVRALVLLVSAVGFNLLYFLFTQFELYLLNAPYVFSTSLISTANSTLVGIVVFALLRYRHILRSLI